MISGEVIFPLQMTFKYPSVWLYLNIIHIYHSNNTHTKSMHVFSPSLVSLCEKDINTGFYPYYNL